MLLLECILGLDRIGRNAQNSVPALVKLGPQLGELDRLPGAAGGVGPGVEVEDELAALEIGQETVAAAIARKVERGCLGALTAEPCAMCLPFVPFPGSMNG